MNATSSKLTSPRHGASSSSSMFSGAGGASAAGFRSRSSKTLSAAPNASAIFEYMSASVLNESDKDCVNSMNDTSLPDLNSPLSTTWPP